MDNFLNYVSLVITQIISYSTIYTLASLGVVLNGNAGIFNISGEGIMGTTAAVAFAVGLITQNWIAGACAAVVIGGIIGFLFIFLHEKYSVGQFVIGIILIIAGTALGNLIFEVIIEDTFIIPNMPTVPVIRIPLLSQVPIVGGLFRQTIFTYLVYILLIGAWYFNYKTKKGLAYRSIGENPKAADVMGVPVFYIRYISTIVTGMLMGLGGAYLPLVVTGSYSVDMIAGRGLMAIGIAIFSNWKPQRVFISALIFAAFEVIAINLQIRVVRQNIYLVQMLPFIGVLVIMMIGKQTNFPNWLGRPYRRE